METLAVFLILFPKLFLGKRLCHFPNFNRHFTFFINIQVTSFQRVFEQILRSKVQNISIFQELFIFWHFILTTFIFWCTVYHLFGVQGTYVLFYSIYTRRFLVCGVCLFAFLMCVWSVWALENRLRYCFALLWMWQVFFWHAWMHIRTWNAQFTDWCSCFVELWHDATGVVK